MLPVLTAPITIGILPYQRALQVSVSKTESTWPGVEVGQALTAARHPSLLRQRVRRRHRVRQRARRLHP